MFKTMVARFESPCRRCTAAGITDHSSRIKVGQKFRYGRMPGWRSGVGYHLAAECPASKVTTNEPQEIAE